MSDPVEAALEKLVAEHAAKAKQVADLKAQYEAESEQLSRLYDAVSSLQRLVDKASPPPVENIIKWTSEDFPPMEPEETQVPAVLKKYLPRGGDGKRLRSTLMVADIAGMTRDPVTRDELRDRFFNHFGTELLSKYWENPDNAFGNAFARAVKEGSILELGKTENGQPLYGGGFVDRETGFPAMYSGEDG
jgi:hypothetical protein